MLDESKTLTDGQRKDVVERFYKFLEEHPDHKQVSVARELCISTGTISGVLKGHQKGPAADRHLARLHNWMELAARRGEIIKSRKFVETAVAREILTVAGAVAETCQMGAIWGPSHIGKTFTLESIEGDPTFGDPVLIRIVDATLAPLPLCRVLCDKFKLPASGTYDALFRRLTSRLEGTKRMLIFDEVERVHYRTLEMIRDLHDQTGCPVLLCGKPKIYERLGLRQVGEWTEITDQLAARIVIRRDLTERTRGSTPQPLFTRDDIRALVKNTQLKLRVGPDAIDWLQGRASAIGTGGVGTALVCLYLAAKVAYVNGDAVITADHLQDVAGLVIGLEDAERILESVQQANQIARLA